MNKHADHNIHARHHALRKLFVNNPDAKRVSHAIAEVVGEYQAAQEDGGRFESRGVAVLGKSGAGKSASVENALSELGLYETKPGDASRPFLIVELSAKASLRAVGADTLTEFGWEALSRDNAQTIWKKAMGYMRDLETFILVLDEIQHVRSAGKDDRESLTSFLKTLVLPRPKAIIPIVVGMSTFTEVLHSDDQLRRRYTQVNLRNLDPAIDLNKAIKSLNQYAIAAEIGLGSCVRTTEFAARLLHASRYSFGEMCAYCRAGIKQAMSDDSTEVRTEHFQDAYRLKTDCLPALNPFIATDFPNI